MMEKTYSDIIEGQMEMTCQDRNEVSTNPDGKPRKSLLTDSRQSTAAAASSVSMNARSGLDTLKCPCCGVRGGNSQRYEAGVSTYVSCTCLFLFVCPLFWLPFCITSCKDKQLLCKNCGELKAVVPGSGCC